MSIVSLQTLSSHVVPQSDGVIERRREDVLSVGRELCKGPAFTREFEADWIFSLSLFLEKGNGSVHRRAVVINQSLETLAGRGVPDATEGMMIKVNISFF